MKNFASQFVLRGLIAMGFGPIVLAIVYLILRQSAVIDTLSVSQVCIGIFSLSALTFIAGLIPTGIAAKKDPVEALRSE